MYFHTCSKPGSSHSDKQAICLLQMRKRNVSCKVTGVHIMFHWLGQRELTGGLVPSLHTQAGKPQTSLKFPCSPEARMLITWVTSWDSPSQFKDNGLALTFSYGEEYLFLKSFFFLRKWGKKEVKICLAHDQATVLTRGNICLESILSSISL